MREDSAKVIVAQSITDEFLRHCVHEYREAECKQRTPRYWAIIAGRMDGVLHAETLHYATNIRDVDSFLITDYHDRRAPKFGGVYKDPRRGYQSDGRDLLNVMRQARAEGREILGSVHMHADLQNLDRPDEISPLITELATPIDQDLFRASGWPLNLIFYVERSKRQLRWTLSAWTPGRDPESDYRQVAVMMPWAQPPSAMTGEG